MSATKQQIYYSIRQALEEADKHARQGHYELAAEQALRAAKVSLYYQAAHDLHRAALQAAKEVKKEA